MDNSNRCPFLDLGRGLRHSDDHAGKQGIADLIRKRLNQLFEPGLGIPQYGLAVADKEDVEVEIQELAQVTPEASRVIHYALRQASDNP